MPLPDFVIVGTCKSGSTSLHQNLRKHPDLYTPSNEVHYFYSRAQGRYNEGPEWYERHFDEAEDGQTVGEKTPLYARVPEVASRMHEMLPEAQLVWIFRDPVQRAHSHYWFNVNLGKEPCSFERALQQERAGEREEDVERAYLRTGLYAEQVERYLEWFSIDSMFFCTLRELKSEPAKLFGRLYNFLGVDHEFADRIHSEQRKTTTHTPYSPWLRHVVLSHFGGQSLARKIEYKLNSRPSSGYPEMDDTVKQDLYDFYASPNQRLREITGLQVEHWNAARLSK
ncbi:hypothetical protein GGQ18_002865 [Salinibacter ruber]|uniref:sulfotransferase family protein n=1 Tax=Salinibacter ruber TaxID=146919 RepID=UPI00161B2523|nr:sulfotransferase [Salinibacter ruber]MBB4070257.1 hypothetical protein [Salinibacter ruber]